MYGKCQFQCEYDGIFGRTYNYTVRSVNPLMKETKSIPASPNF